MRKLATLTKSTNKGLSVWTFAFCDGVFLAFGGITNRCKVFTDHKQLEECMFSYAKYGYKIERASKSSASNTIVRHKNAQAFVKKLSSVEEDLDAPRPEADTLVAAF